MESKNPLESSCYIPGILLGSLERERGNMAALTRLANLATDDAHKDFIKQIRLDAKKHECLLAKAYKIASGRQAAPSKAPTLAPLGGSLSEECENMFIKLLDDADIYLRLRSSSPDEIKEILYEIIAENQMNALKLSHLSLSLKA
jgi:hypothetical protein